MTFYKLQDISTNYEFYTNPKHIELYVYHENYVKIRFTSGKYANVDKSDFEHMMIIEGAYEYWNTQHTIALLSITLTKS